jgi:hypothetical protein
MQNKPNFPHFSPENDDSTEKQSQFKANQSQSPDIVVNRLRMLEFLGKTEYYL